MTTNFPNSASTHANRDPSPHRCTSVMEKLRLIISREDNFVNLHDVAIVLEQALSLAPLSTVIMQCPFCPSVSKIIRIAQHIEAKFRNMREHALLQSTNRLESISRELLDDFENDCRKLKELLQSIMDVHESELKDPVSASFRADMLGGGRGVRFEGGTVTNVAGSSNSLVFIKKEESAVGFWGLLVLLLLGFLVFRVL